MRYFSPPLPTSLSFTYVTYILPLQKINLAHVLISVSSVMGLVNGGSNLIQFLAKNQKNQYNLINRG